MADEQEQIAVRRQKLAALRALDASAFPNDFVPNATPATVAERFGPLDEAALVDAPAVRVGGRVPRVFEAPSC